MDSPGGASSPVQLLQQVPWPSSLTHLEISFAEGSSIPLRQEALEASSGARSSPLPGSRACSATPDPLLIRRGAG